MLNPSDSIVDWVLKTVPTMGAGWCPPGILGIGIGGTPEKPCLLAKESIMAPVDMHELIERGPSNRIEELRIELYEKVNALGIGAQGLGGLTTVLTLKSWTTQPTPLHCQSVWYRTAPPPVTCISTYMATAPPFSPPIHGCLAASKLDGRHRKKANGLI